MPREGLESDLLSRDAPHPRFIRTRQKMWKEALTDALSLALRASCVRAIMVSERHSLLHLITHGKKQPGDSLAVREASSSRATSRMRSRDRRSITHCIAIRNLMSHSPMKRGVRARRGNYFMAAKFRDRIRQRLTI